MISELSARYRFGASITAGNVMSRGSVPEILIWARMYVGRIAPLSAIIFYPVDKYIKMVCMSPG